MANHALTALRRSVEHLPCFRYGDHLVKGQMRLLKLCGFADGGAMQFQLRTIELPSPDGTDGLSPAPYIALSYVWGDESDKLPVVVDGQRALLTQNLFGALAHLGPELLKHNIWVDAVCINQTDNVEKLGQIEQIGDIYRGAESVFAYLGGRYQNSDAAMRDIDGIGRAALDAGIDTLTLKALRTWPSFDGVEDAEERRRLLQVRERLYAIMDGQMGGLFSWSKMETQAVNALFRRPWFSRA